MCLLTLLVLATVSGCLGQHSRQRRSISSSFGKRITSSLVAELGKRPKEMYSFGIGKRSISPQEMAEYLAETSASEGGSDRSNSEVAPSSPHGSHGGSSYFSTDKRDPYAFGLGKRDPYTFGLGKRDPYTFGLGKRDPYTFGLGKRAGEYSFGLGKKRAPYTFGLGKRSENEPHYAFGMGKKEDPYAFGLGKRDPYTFGLGKKRDPYAFGLGKRDPYAFGLGKRDPYSFGLGK